MRVFKHQGLRAIPHHGSWPVGKGAKAHDFSSARTSQKLLWGWSASFYLNVVCVFSISQVSVAKACFGRCLPCLAFPCGVMGSPEAQLGGNRDSSHPVRNESPGHEGANVRPQVQRVKK